MILKIKQNRNFKKDMTQKIFKTNSLMKHKNKKII